MYGCGFLVLEQTAQEEKRRKATPLLLVVGCKQAFDAGQGKGREWFRHLWRWRGWRVCSKLRLCVRHSWSVSNERKTNLLVSIFFCWLICVRNNELKLRSFGHS